MYQCWRQADEKIKLGFASISTVMENNSSNDTNYRLFYSVFFYSPGMMSCMAGRSLSNLWCAINVPHVDITVPT